MATMVLSSFGAAVAGPFGGAVGALIGNGLDRRLLGQRSSRPKHGDLSVQSSSFGSAIPQVFGRMRVAGTVIWATPPHESSRLATLGSRTDVPQTPDYLVSFAVALSSRRVGQVRRIWAEGRLIRDESGKFEFPLTMRFFNGDEDQPTDVLIASAEGIEHTPAYRGTSVLVFEDFPIAFFGNRIPSLTVEVEADAGQVRLGAVLQTVSRKAITDGGAGNQVVDGYAAYGETIRDAIDPLVAAFDIDLVDRGGALTCFSLPTITELEEQELGAQEEAPALRVSKAYRAEREMPKTVGLSYYDRERDYQSGLKQAVAGAGSKTTLLDLPAVMSASAARRLAEEKLSREWKTREQLRVSLPLSRVTVQPGDEIQLPDVRGSFRVVESRIEAFSTHLELEQSRSHSAFLLPAESGRLTQGWEKADERPLELVLFEAPLSDEAHEIVLYLAAAGGGSSRSPGPVELMLRGESMIVYPKREEAIVGTALTLIGAGSSALIDRSSSVEVQLSDPGRWLEGRDDLALANGANLALLGDELIQFGVVQTLGPGHYKLSHLLRGRKATEWAVSSHKVGERFVLIDPRAVSTLKLPLETLHGVLTHGQDPAVAHAITGENLRSPSPVRLSAVSSSEGVDLTWIGRSSSDWNWLSEVDLSSTHNITSYRVTLTGDEGSINREVRGSHIYFTVSEIRACGKDLQVEVVSLSRVLPSRPAQLNLI